eukprot:g11742.t1
MSRDDPPPSPSPGPTTTTRLDIKVDASDADDPSLRKFSVCLPFSGRGHWQDLVRRVAGEEIGLPVSEKLVSDQALCFVMQPYEWLEQLPAVLKKGPDCWISRYPGMGDLCEKCNQTRWLHRLDQLFPPLVGEQEAGGGSLNTIFTLQREYIPRTYLWPGDREKIRETFYNSGGKLKRKAPVLIVKPEDGSQGDGIFLVDKFRDLEIKGSSCKTAVVQAYVKNPLLLGDLKFDLRVYAVVIGGWEDEAEVEEDGRGGKGKNGPAATSGMRLFLCRDGLGRFCTEKYEPPSGSNLSSSQKHLTNYSIQKRQAGYVREGDLKGSEVAADVILRAAPSFPGGPAAATAGLLAPFAQEPSVAAVAEGEASGEDDSLPAQPPQLSRDAADGRRAESGGEQTDGHEKSSPDEPGEGGNTRKNRSAGRVQSSPREEPESPERETPPPPEVSSEREATKRTLTVTLEQLKEEYKDAFSEPAFWAQLSDIVSQWVTAMSPILRASWRPFQRLAPEGSPARCPCFQVLGFDVLLDQKFRMHLLEVNNSPSLSIDEVVPLAPTSDAKTAGFPKVCRCMEHHQPHTHHEGPVDYKVKSKLVRGVLHLANARSLTSAGGKKKALGRRKIRKKKTGGVVDHIAGTAEEVSAGFVVDDGLPGPHVAEEDGCVPEEKEQLPNVEDAQAPSFLDRWFVEVPVAESMLPLLSKLEAVYSTRLLGARATSNAGGRKAAAAGRLSCTPTTAAARSVEDMKASAHAFLSDVTGRTPFTSFAVRRLLRPLPLSGGDIDLLLVRFKQEADYTGVGGSASLGGVSGRSIPAALEMADLVLLLELVRRKLAQAGNEVSMDDLLDRLLVEEGGE